ncbi:MAG: hypothetical protein KIS92_09225 [Planctomycetota bacterium]|nr:hypothetical protein [Planctomycetota bacterium]
MALYREKTPDVWIVAAPRHQEALGLLLLALSVTVLGVTLYRMLNGLLAFVQPLLVGLAVGAVGAEFLLRNDRYIFDRASKTLFLKRPFRRTVGWDFSALERIELVRAPGGRRDAELVFKDGARAFLSRGEAAAAETEGGKLAAFVGVPLEKKGA